MMNREELTRKLQAYCDENFQSGMLRVTIRDEIQYEAAFGWADWENRIPFSKDSMFTLYSMSKPFCAMGFLKLKDRGLVDLDDHPARYVPEVAGIDSRVTFRHMLHHVSGLPSFGQMPEFKKAYAPGTHGRFREQLKLLKDYPMAFAPGTSDFYANINFALPAFAIENITGMTYDAYMKQEVFTPLGMETVVVDEEGTVIPNRVQGYNLVDGQRIPVERSRDWMLGGGDLTGRVEDVYCLNKAVKHKLLLREETWEEVLTPSPINNKGMGCTITQWHGKHRITHNGGHRGFRTLHIHLPEDDFDLIWLSNSGFGEARKDIAEMVYEVFYGSDETLSETVEMDKGYI